MPNLLIQPAPVPSWGLAQQRAAQMKGMQTQNLLAEQQLEAQPYKQKLTELGLHLERQLLDIEKQAFQLKRGDKMETQVQVGDDTYVVKGYAENVANVVPQIRNNLGQLDEKTIPWAASLGVGIEKKERKVSPYGPEALAFEKGKAGFKESWSASKAGILDGKNVFFQTNDQGGVRIVGGGIQPEPKKGMKIYDRDGNLLVDMSGGGTTGEMTPKTKGTIEEKLLGGKEQLARMQSIQEQFKPEYQEIPSRLGKTWTSIKASFGQNIPKEDAKELTEFKKFQRKSIENINLYIKELTGAQMSEKEADRLRLAQPDPGEKWYSGDDPITFKAKMDDVLKATRAAVARYEYYKTKGLSDTQIKSIVNDNTAIPLETLMEKMK